MAKNSIYDYSTTPSSNTDIAGTGIQGTNAVSNFDDAFRTLMAQIAVDVSPRRMSIWGGLYGLTLSNNGSDATNDIDIAVGMAATDSTTDPRTMVLSSALTKRLDAAWAVGSGNGGLDTGAIANTTYHIWLIQRSDTGVVDALFSTSATSPTMPANYDRKRRIGAILRESAAIVLFDQDEDIFMRRASSTTRNNTAAAASALLTFAVPLGIPVRPITSLNFVVSASVAATMALGSAASGAATFTACSVNTGVGGQAAAFNQPPPIFTTNTSAQLYFAQVNSVGTPAGSTVLTLGWVDRRGRT